MARGSKPVGILDADGKVRRWTAVVDVAPDPATGKRKQKRLSARTKKALEAKIADTLGEVRRGDYLEPSALPLADYLPQWLDAHAATVGASTAHQYASICRTRLLPRLGAVPLARLTPLVIQAHYQHLREAGYAPGSVRQAHLVLHAALAQAVKWGMLPRNPAALARAPAPSPPPRATWDADQCARFLAATAADRFGVLWRLLVETGMRLGEGLALRWQDVDWERGAVRVRQRLTRTRDGRVVLGQGAKTDAGQRPIEVTPDLLDALRAQRKAVVARRLRAAAWEEHDLVFPRDAGRWHDHADAERAFKAAVAALGLPPLTPHGLRHSNATLLLRLGVHPKIVQERLGHASVRTTLDLYSHVVPGMQTPAVASLAGLFAADRDRDVTGTAPEP